MERSRRIAWTFLFAPGMFLLGLVTCGLLPFVPALTGAVMAIVLIAGLSLGLGSALVGALAYCAGAGAAGTLLLGAPLWPAAAWLLALMAGVLLLVVKQLRAKVPVVHVMLRTGGAVFAFGALTYIALNLMLGDVVARMGTWLEGMLTSLAESAPELYDLTLSTWSLMGVLPDVGLTGPVTALSGQTRTVLTANLLETFDLSLRMNLMNLLAQQAMHIAFLGTLLPLMLRVRRGEGESYSKMGDLAMARIPAKANLFLMLGILALWVLMIFSQSVFAVYAAGWSVVQFVYAVQGLSVCEWFFRKHGWSRAARYVVMGLGYLFLPWLLFFIGFLEQVFYFRKIGRPRPEDFGLRGGDDDDSGDPRG
jgi:hypothetical protein